MECLFCKIINGDLPSSAVYDDAVVKAFLDINPTTNGNLLIVPKKHYENIIDIDLTTLNHINKVAKKLYSLLKEKLHIDGLTLIQNNGLGQEIKHYHLHLTPRYVDDNIKHSFNKDLLIDIKDVYQKLTSE